MCFRMHVAAREHAEQAHMQALMPAPGCLPWTLVPTDSGAVLCDTLKQGIPCSWLLLSGLLAAGAPPVMVAAAAKDTGAQGEGKRRKSSKRSRRDQEMLDVKGASTTATQDHSTQGSNAACALHSLCSLPQHLLGSLRKRVCSDFLLTCPVSMPWIDKDDVRNNPSAPLACSMCR